MEHRYRIKQFVRLGCVLILIAAVQPEASVADSLPFDIECYSLTFEAEKRLTHPRACKLSPEKTSCDIAAKRVSISIQEFLNGDACGDGWLLSVRTGPLDYNSGPRAICDDGSKPPISCVADQNVDICCLYSGGNHQ